MPIDDRAIRKRVQGFIATGAGQGDPLAEVRRELECEHSGADPAHTKRVTDAFYEVSRSGPAQAHAIRA